MLPRSRFESEWERIARLEDELRRDWYAQQTREQAAFDAAYSTGYDNDEPDPDPEMECESRSH